MAVMRTLIDVDDDLLEAVKASLGTTTKKAMVNAALAEISPCISAPRLRGG